MPDDADSRFAAHAAATLDAMLELQPELATEVGDHRYDDRLTVGTAAYYEQASRWAAGRLAELTAIDAARLSPQNRVDAQILANHLARLRFGIEELREHEWDPMVANPLACLPQSLAAARTVLTAMPEVHIETALTQFAGTQHLISEELSLLVE